MGSVTEQKKRTNVDPFSANEGAEHPHRSGPLDALSHPGVPERRSRRDRRATEAALEAAALRLVARDGILAGLSLREVASEAGLNRALVYQYFGSRRALMRAALRTLRESRQRMLRLVRTLPFVERRRLVFRGAIEDPVFARVEALLALDGDDELQVFPTLPDALSDLARYQDNGELDPGLNAAAIHAVSMSAQLGYCIFRDQYIAEFGLPPEELDREAERVFVSMLEGLRPRAEAVPPSS